MPDPVAVFVSAFGLSSFAGLAALLRSGGEVGWMAAASAFLNAGLFGLGISLVWYVKFQDNIYFLLGICVLSGLAGSTIIDFALEAARKKGLSLFGVNVEKKS